MTIFGISFLFKRKQPNGFSLSNVPGRVKERRVTGRVQGQYVLDSHQDSLGNPASGSGGVLRPGELG